MTNRFLPLLLSLIKKIVFTYGKAGKPDPLRVFVFFCFVLVIQLFKTKRVLQQIKSSDLGKIIQILLTTIQGRYCFQVEGRQQNDCRKAENNHKKSNQTFESASWFMVNVSLIKTRSLNKLINLF